MSRRGYRLRFAGPARQDIVDIERYSIKNFGEAAAERYSRLIQQAMLDLLADPMRPGVKQRTDLASDMRVYHLSLSRDRVEGVSVKSPRHFVVFRVSGNLVEIARVLHDSCDLARHLPVREE